MAVAIIKDENVDYCTYAPFHPPVKYPEYPFEGICATNHCYSMLREVFHRLGMDEKNFGKEKWDPLGDVIRPGDHVLIKPNFVLHYNKVGGILPLVTHGSIIRGVLDYVYIALKGKGNISIGDAPYLNADFDQITRLTGMDKVLEYYQDNSDIRLSYFDIRQYRGDFNNVGGIKRAALKGDPLGYTVVDLKDDSDHYGIIGDSEKFRNNYHKKSEIARHHNMDRNEYYISNSVLKADVLINLPKLKTHGKAGMTCAQKNLVGINGVKDWLPHHRAGSAMEGGDDYLQSELRKDMLSKLIDRQADTDNLLYAMSCRAAFLTLQLSKRIIPLKEDISGGSWYGNDTIPRTIADLNKIAFYADKNGELEARPQRKMFIVVDSIIAGEKDGPTTPEPKKCGVLVAGYNPVEIDLVCSRIMGFDYRKIPTFKYTMNSRKYKLFGGDPSEIRIFSDVCDSFNKIYDTYNCCLVPPKGWVGHIEYEVPGSVIGRPIELPAKV
jgi:uncharacterized protein (DUF362 family)